MLSEQCSFGAVYWLFCGISDLFKECSVHAVLCRSSNLLGPCSVGEQFSVESVFWPFCGTSFPFMRAVSCQSSVLKIQNLKSFIFHPNTILKNRYRVPKRAVLTVMWEQCSNQAAFCPSSVLSEQCSIEEVCVEILTRTHFYHIRHTWLIFFNEKGITVVKISYEIPSYAPANVITEYAAASSVHLKLYTAVAAIFKTYNWTFVANFAFIMSVYCDGFVS